jgi:hypothetical protein
VGSVEAWVEIAPTEGITYGHREPTVMSLVVMAMPSILVRAQRAVMENVLNSMPGMTPMVNLLLVSRKTRLLGLDLAHV